jgi:hypothetical protein
MKKLLLTAFISLVTAEAIAADVGVSIRVGEPGFYGRIDIGTTYPQPQLIYREPIVIQHAPAAVEPIYLHVPPGHAKKWSKHCHKYNACGQPVYFVQDNWYNNVYVPRYNKNREHGDHDYNEHGKKDKMHKEHGRKEK